jgi:hypothetical protein
MQGGRLQQLELWKMKTWSMHIDLAQYWEDNLCIGRMDTPMGSMEEEELDALRRLDPQHIFLGNFSSIFATSPISKTQDALYALWINLSDEEAITGHFVCVHAI